MAGDTEELTVEISRFRLLDRDGMLRNIRG